MSQQKVSEQTTECAACGGPIVVPTGNNKQFCSISCYRTGRMFCRQCNEPLGQTAKAKKTFCNDNCRRKYYRVQAGISPSPLDEVRRSTCKVCDNPMPQNVKGGRRLFCSPRCCRVFHIIKNRGGDVTQEWGTFGTETRKTLLEVQTYMGIGAAKRLATAIDTEYIRRKPNVRISDGFREYVCKTCGGTFKRRPWGYQSKEYCSDVCLPKLGRTSGERASRGKLTWELVDEIRHCYATESLSFNALGRKYGVARQNIARIVRCEIWKPEHDPRRKGQDE